MTPHAMELFSIFLGALGTFLLVREVSKGHYFEGKSREMISLTREMRLVQEMTDLYKTNLREFWIRSQMDLLPKVPRAEIEDMAKTRGHDQIIADASVVKDRFEREAPAALKRFEKTTQFFETTFAESQLKVREILLWTGRIL